MAYLSSVGYPAYLYLATSLAKRCRSRGHGSDYNGADEANQMLAGIQERGYLVPDTNINVCCPYFDVIPCGDTDGHKHIACRGMVDGKLISNGVAKTMGLGVFEQCPFRPKGEDGEPVN